jgi:hypothetical protein
MQYEVLQHPDDDHRFVVYSLIIELCSPIAPTADACCHLFLKVAMLTKKTKLIG